MTWEHQLGLVMVMGGLSALAFVVGAFWWILKNR